MPSQLTVARLHQAPAIDIPDIWPSRQCQCQSAGGQLSAPLRAPVVIPTLPPTSPYKPLTNLPLTDNLRISKSVVKSASQSAAANGRRTGRVVWGPKNPPHRLYRTDFPYSLSFDKRGTV